MELLMLMLGVIIAMVRTARKVSMRAMMKTTTTTMSLPACSATQLAASLKRHKIV